VTAASRSTCQIVIRRARPIRIIKNSYEVVAPLLERNASVVNADNQPSLGITPRGDGHEPSLANRQDPDITLKRDAVEHVLRPFGSFAPAVLE
jgi:hypothetical protein